MRTKNPADMLRWCDVGRELAHISAMVDVISKGYTSCES